MKQILLIFLIVSLEEPCENFPEIQIELMCTVQFSLFLKLFDWKVTALMFICG